MTLQIVIVSWNARADLERCLRSLEEAPPVIPHEIVVVDNASSDGSAEMVAGLFPRVRLLRNADNVGFARANNLALRQGATELALLLNPDTIVPPGAVDTLVSRLTARPGAAAAGPRIVDGQGAPELSFGGMPGPFVEARRKALAFFYSRGVVGTDALVRQMTAHEREVDWVSGACLLVRRRCAEAVGLLDERYQLYWEDVDFCAALRARGWTILFTPAASITHLRGRSAMCAPRQTSRAYREAHLAFYAKHRPRWLPFLRWYTRVRYDR